jgi:hypothetical protein
MRVKAGDRVKLIGIPPNLKDDEVLQTRSLFEKCVGRCFVVAAVEVVDGLTQRLARLDVGHVLGVAPYVHTIWVEEEYLQIAK